jgi:hypothetical protein
MILKTPIGWRKGQTIFNFLEWLADTKGYERDNKQRMVDPFHFDDETFDALYKEYISGYETRKPGNPKMIQYWKDKKKNG